MAGRELDVRAARAPTTPAEALEWLRIPSWDRYDIILWALGRGLDAGDVQAATGIDPWFLAEFERLAAARRDLAGPARRPRRRRPARARAAPGWPTATSPAAVDATRARGGASAAAPWACGRPTTRSTPAPPSSRP